MKYLVAMTVLALSPSLWAAAQCAAGEETVKTCLSTPQSGDHEVASNMFDTVIICSAGEKVSMVFAKDSEIKEIPAKVEVRMGGTTYYVQAADGTRVGMSLITGTRTPNTEGELTITLTTDTPPISASSTYTCK